MSGNTTPGITPGPKQSTNTKSNRLPAPTLFVGPPSRNASQLSIARPLPGGRTKSTLKTSYLAENVNEPGNSKEGNARTDAPAFRRPSEKSIDAKWREMQSTLNEVELTAQSSTHVFGESHSRALDDLRLAQVALAKAWGRGSESKETPVTPTVGTVPEMSWTRAEDVLSERQQQQQQPTRQRAETQTSVSTVLSDESQLSESSARSGRSQLEDETAQDIKLAGERRAANEAYFKRVDQGVKEVVEKLERVAEAMRGVEAESRSLWSSSDRVSSEEGDAKPAAPAVTVS